MAAPYYTTVKRRERPEQQEDGLQGSPTEGPPIKNGHDALQSLEAINMLPVTPTFLAMSHVTYLSAIAALY